MVMRSISALWAAKVPESQRVEYKREVPLGTRKDRDEALKDFSAMGNGGGGRIVVGIADDDGSGDPTELCPLPDTSVVDRIASLMNDGLSPTLLYEPSVEEVEGGWLVAFEISPSLLGPYQVIARDDCRYYQRIGRSVRRMTEPVIRAAYSASMAADLGLEARWTALRLPIAHHAAASTCWVSSAVVPALHIERWTPGGLDWSLFSRLPRVAELGTSAWVAGLRDLEQLSFSVFSDGVYATEVAVPRLPPVDVRVHLDGSAGIASRGEPDALSLARTVDGQLWWLGLVANEIGLGATPIEVRVAVTLPPELSIPGFAEPIPLVVPPHKQPDRLARAAEQMLPSRLLSTRARHQLVRRLSDAIHRSYGLNEANVGFRGGYLFGNDGEEGCFMDGSGFRVERRSSTYPIQEGVLSIGANPVRQAWWIGDALIDENGDTLAVCEFACSVATPDTWTCQTLCDAPDVERWGRPLSVQAVANEHPTPTGKWSPSNLATLLQIDQ